MARTDLAVASVDEDGAAPAPAAANADGHAVPNRHGDVIIEVVNGDASPHTLTVVTGAQFHGYDIADDDHVIAAGATLRLALTNTALYNQPAGADRNKVHLNFDAVTGVTIEAYRVA